MLREGAEGRSWEGAEGEVGLGPRGHCHLEGVGDVPAVHHGEAAVGGLCPGLLLALACHGQNSLHTKDGMGAAVRMCPAVSGRLTIDGGRRFVSSYVSNHEQTRLQA